MNRGIILKALRETGPTTLLLAAVIFAIEAAFNFVLPTFQDQIAKAFPQMKLFQNVLRAMTGAEIPPDLATIGPEVLQSLCWVHPIVLIVFCSHAAIVATRLPAGEIERGTIDLLLGLPVSRAAVFLSESLVCLASAGVLILGAFLGHRLGAALAPAGLRPDTAHVVIILVNLLSLYFSVAGISWLLSTLSSRRGPAATGVFVILIATFVLNYLAQFWEPLRSAVWLSLLRYYRPLPILQNGLMPWADVAVLLGVGAACWIAAGVVFARRDITTT